MKRLSVTLFALLLITAGFATKPETADQVLSSDQVAKLDVSGKWSGTRNQYSWDKKSFIESFQYEFDLKQDGNTVTGTSTIITANGEYADMKLEGVIVGNKLHFREYEVQNAIRPDGKVWCFKSGELNFVKDADGNLKLTGSTPSFMEVYNYPCSGGETNLKKVDNSANEQVLQAVTPTTPAASQPSLAITAYPNPFVESSNISYNLTADSKVTLQVFDISGKLVTGLYDGNQKAGFYVYSFDAKNFTAQSGFYIVKMVVNGNIYSQQMVQVR
ncbi:MAG TPA: T9SS type A sorting domain-containing protein [Chitinophagales bacterium]|nr:T9SS type A sorting domain-containing protein [Chitinophagales bacterium]